LDKAGLAHEKSRPTNVNLQKDKKLQHQHHFTTLHS